ncbi:PREDICTED: zinc finger HIT domain-containing protein 3 [Dinoponera quadriceps]|uniref:Zinc finger HIT domain-containing protein 3 n=1 Tax=Dinoponera quadriceps TaxID=609295 RepID=A0A6P3X769_DINQU|nr:PREDICTED: zinc finger HIT domain-containing protein 3 [Dinoponera quadriceps]XP_014474113.1 PREDICTED: zinc finger HIT domain-containing protein 3 [Dinoponera quadriceps]
MLKERIKICCVCKKKDVPYKCPTCRKPYCSVACCKEHKAQVCEPPKVSANLEEPQESNNIKQRYLFPTEDTVPVEKLEKLRDSNELKQCLANPHVREMLKEVVHSRDPTKAIANAMREPIFVEMADACLKIAELPEEDRPC